PVDEAPPGFALALEGLGELAAHLREQLGEHLTGIADDGDLDIAVLPDLGRIDIGVDDLRVRGERIEPAGDAGVEAGGDGAEEMGVLERGYRGRAAVDCG